MSIDDKAIKAFLGVIHGHVTDQYRLMRDVPGDYDGNRHRQTVASVLSALGEAVAAMGVATEEATKPAPSDAEVMGWVAKLCCNDVIPDRVTPTREDHRKARAIIDYLHEAGLLNREVA